ncbi:unnamed protein product, partial [Polarella glacialis]
APCGDVAVTTQTAMEPRASLNALPAPWPYSRVINNKEPGLEATSLVVLRTVTPEAHAYFNRIVQVAQNELEKLLIHKVQNIFDPVQDGQLGLAAMKAPVGLAEKRRCLPSAKDDPHRSKVKSALEGQQLTAYVVSVIGRIMVDFSRFADVVLRWQRKSAGADDKVTFGQIPEKLPAEGTDSVWFREMVDRLERQDKQNTELESKYSGVANELRERKRQFLRERSIWKERLRNLQAHARESGDRALDKLLYHDVQFYAEVGERSVEDVQDEYERKLVEQELKFQ